MRIFNYCRIAQSVERRTVNPYAVGSTPPSAARTLQQRSTSWTGLHRTCDTWRQELHLFGPIDSVMGRRQHTEELASHLAMTIPAPQQGVVLNGIQ